MSETYDVGIIGTGTMGSAAAYHLARRGRSVIAFEQFGIVHEFGSHSGTTRIIRRAYHESPEYVPLVLRSEELWEELEKATGQQMMFRTGALCLGPENSDLLNGALLACKQYNLPFDLFSSAEVMQKWPQFRLPQNWQACFDHLAGFLIVELCIRSHAQLAIQSGAKIMDHTKVTGFKTEGSAIQVQTDRGSFRVGSLIVCAGAWTTRLLNELQIPITIKRKSVVWMKPRNPADYSMGTFPIFLSEVEQGLLYGFPLYEHTGVKIANHSSKGEPVNPDTVDRVFHDSDAADVRDFAGKYLPGITNEIVEGKVCLYSLTPDEDFLIDRHPHQENIIVAAGFSGHGFKFSPVIGEILADLATEGKTVHHIEKFRISRFFNH